MTEKREVKAIANKGGLRVGAEASLGAAEARWGRDDGGERLSPYSCNGSMGRRGRLQGGGIYPI